MVKKLQIKINERWLTNVFAKLDIDNSGYIEYEEFLAFISNDPYGE
jgi:Ca2+-binding EF-hand superfamily protein